MGGYWRLEMRLGLVLGYGNAFRVESGPECWRGEGVPPPPFKRCPGEGVTLFSVLGGHSGSPHQILSILVEHKYKWWPTNCSLLITSGTKDMKFRETHQHPSLRPKRAVMLLSPPLRGRKKWLFPMGVGQEASRGWGPGGAFGFALERPPCHGP